MDKDTCFPDSSHTFIQHPYGFALAHDVNNLLLAAVPLVHCDSWLTLCMGYSIYNAVSEGRFVLENFSVMDNFELGYNINNADFPVGGNLGEMVIGLLAAFDSLSVGNPDTLGRVLLGRFTFRNYLSGDFYMSVRKVNPDFAMFSPLTTYTQKVSFFYGPEIIPPDFDGDGTVDVTDLLILLSEFGCTFSCNADLDANGQVGVSDLITFIYYYNAE